MSVRLVTGKIERTDGTPWQNTRVQFRRSKGTFTSQAQYPPDIVEAQTDVNGNLYTVQNSLIIRGVFLWCNSEGNINTAYECILPGDSFTFNLPIGSQSISLSAVRAGNSNSSNPENTTILEYIDRQIELALTVLDVGSFYEVLNYSNINTINLANVSQLPHKSRVYVNGTKQKFGLDYNIDANLFNWISTNLSLHPNYTIEVYY